MYLADIMVDFAMGHIASSIDSRLDYVTQNLKILTGIEGFLSFLFSMGLSTMSKIVWAGSTIFVLSCVILVECV